MQIVKFLFLTLALVLFTYCSQSQTSNSAPVITAKPIIDSTCRALLRSYVYPAKAEKIRAYLQQKLKTGTYDLLADGRELAEATTRDMRAVQPDNHLTVRYDPELEKRILAYVARPQADANDLAKERAKNFFFQRVEMLRGNIGYVAFTGFAVPTTAARKVVRAAFQFVSHADALIIDLRNNFGGNPQMSQEILGYFFPEKTYTGRSFNRLENRWTNQYVGGNQSPNERLVLNMPVFILTSSRTFSAAEGLAYLLQSFQKGLVVGDTTRGGAHLTRSFSIGNGFVAFIPYLRGENAKTRTDWEGVGVLPNLSVHENDALLAAQNEILKAKLERADDEKEQSQIRWLMGFNQAQQKPAAVRAGDYEKATGRYAEFEISIKEAVLVFRDTNQPTVTYKRMIPITSSLFQVENDYQVELLKDEQGQYRSINVSWEDGFSEIIKKTD